MYGSSGALTFAELGTVVPRSGAEYTYFIDSYGPLHKFWGNVPAFLCSWIFVVVPRPAELAVITLTFAEYFCAPIAEALCIEDAASFEYVKKLVAMLALGKIKILKSVNSV